MVFPQGVSDSSLNAALPMDEERKNVLFQQAVSCDSEQLAALLETLDRAERESLEMLLQADELAGQEGMFESIQPAVATRRAPGLSTGNWIRDYELLEVVGNGGMGTVYRAHHCRLQRDFAIKLLPQFERIQQPDTIARFQREMAAVGKLKHSNIVQATDAGEEAGVHFLVLEFVDGADVGRIVSAQGKLRIEDACEIVRQTALGLQHAHDLQLIHRDIKPSNLLVSKDGTIKLADMGLALLKTADDLTNSGQIMGTLNYVSPEQIEKSHTVDGQSDLYSLGCTFYHLLVGRAPFDLPEFEGPLQKLRAHENEEPIPIGQLRSDVPEGVAAIVDSLLQKNPTERIASAAQLAAALATFAHNAQLGQLVRRSAIAHETEGSTDRAPAIGIDTHKMLHSSAIRTEAKRRSPPAFSWAWIGMIACAALLVLALNAGDLFRIVTNKGILVIENGDGIKVTVVRGEEDSVIVVDSVAKRQYTLDVGENYQLEISEPGTGTTFRSQTFSISRNAKTVFDAKVEMLDSAPAKEGGYDWLKENAQSLAFANVVQVSSSTQTDDDHDFYDCLNLISGKGLMGALVDIQAISTVTHDYATNDVAWRTQPNCRQGVLVDYFVDRDPASNPTLRFVFDQPTNIKAFVYWGYARSEQASTASDEPSSFKFTCFDSSGRTIGPPVVRRFATPTKLQARAIELPLTTGVAAVEVEMLDNFHDKAARGSAVGMSEVCFLAENPSGISRPIQRTVVSYDWDWINENAGKLSVVAPVGAESPTVNDYYPISNLIDGSGLSKDASTVRSLESITHQFATDGGAWVTDRFRNNGVRVKDYFAASQLQENPTIKFTLPGPATIEGFVFWGYVHTAYSGGHGNEPSAFNVSFRDAAGELIGEPLFKRLGRPTMLQPRFVKLPTTAGVTFVELEILDNFSSELRDGDRIGMSEVRFLSAAPN